MSRSMLSLAVLGALLFATSPAEAVRTVELPLRNGLAYDAPLKSNFQTAVYLPEPARHVNVGNHSLYDIDIEQGGMRIMIQPKGVVPATNINIRTDTAYVTLFLTMAQCDAEAITVISYVHPHQWEGPLEPERDYCGPPGPLHLDRDDVASEHDDTTVTPGFRAVFADGVQFVMLTTGSVSRGLFSPGSG